MVPQWLMYRLRRGLWLLTSLLWLPVFAFSGFCEPQAPKLSAQMKNALQAHGGGYLNGPRNKRVVVFVNGVWGDAVSSWQNSDGFYWPLMLANDNEFSNVDIYIHSFDSPRITIAQNIDELAKSMTDHLMVDGVLEKHDQVVFVCHSMGGLVTRAFLLKVRPAPNKVPMIYFYSTPTTGANIAAIGSHLSQNPQLRDMLPLKEDGYLADLQDAWLATADDPRVSYPTTIASYCAYELLDTFGFRVVERQSATNLCNRETRGIRANHLDIVKPADSSADQYVAFKAAYERTFSPVAIEVRKALKAKQAAPTTFAWTDTLGASQVFSTRAEELILRRVRATRTSIEVGCQQTKTGNTTARVEAGTNETLVEVDASIENVENVSKYSAAPIRHDDNEHSATLRYSLTGNCPSGGHADVVASFVFSRVPR
jgi:hypothetical protein